MTGRFDRRRILALLTLAVALAATPAIAAASDDPWPALARGGHVILMRHATTVPGTGDPPGFRLDACATQRNLSDSGRAEAQAAGAMLRRRGVPVGRVLTSAWCRCRDTAELMALGDVAVEPALNSFFAGQGDREGQTAAARRIAGGWPGPGNLLMVTHQVNITALTGVFPRQGEMVVLRPEGGDRFAVVGRIPPP